MGAIDVECPIIPALLREINVAVKKTSTVLSTCPEEASVLDLATNLGAITKALGKALRWFRGYVIRHCVKEGFDVVEVWYKLSICVELYYCIPPCFVLGTLCVVRCCVLYAFIKKTKQNEGAPPTPSSQHSQH